MNPFYYIGERLGPSKVRLFAGDIIAIIAYLKISSDQDAKTLQSDLDKLTKWETSWAEHNFPAVEQIPTGWFI